MTGFIKYCLASQTSQKLLVRPKEISDNFFGRAAASSDIWQVLAVFTFKLCHIFLLPVLTLSSGEIE